MSCPNLEYLDSDESNESDKEESNKLGSESGSIGTYGTGLGGLLGGVEFPVGVMLPGNDLPFNGDGGSLFPSVHLGL